MSPIDSWDGATAVFTGGPNSLLTVLFVLASMAVLVAFLVTMIQHENHAYAQMIHHEPVEAGPAVEGEPPVY